MFRNRQWHTDSKDPGRYSDLYALSNHLIYFTKRERITEEHIVANEEERKTLVSAWQNQASRMGVLRSLSFNVGSIVEGLEIGLFKKKDPRGDGTTVDARLTLMETSVPFGVVQNEAQSRKTSATLGHWNALNAMRITVNARRSLMTMLPSKFVDWQHGQKSQIGAIDRALSSLLDGHVHLHSTIWHDATIAMKAAYVTDTISLCSELKRGILTKVKSAVEIRPPRSNIEIFKGHTEGDFGVMGLVRLVNHKNFKLDAGAEVFSEKGEPANAGASTRLTFVSPKTNKRSNLVVSLGAMRLYAAITSELSKKYGVTLSSQLLTIAPADASVFSTGVMCEPSKEIVPALKGEYTFHGRIDSFKGASAMIRKRNFLLEGLTAEMSMSTRAPIDVCGKNSYWQRPSAKENGGAHLGFTITMN